MIDIGLIILSLCEGQEDPAADCSCTAISEWTEEDEQQA